MMCQLSLLVPTQVFDVLRDMLDIEHIQATRAQQCRMVPGPGRNACIVIHVTVQWAPWLNLKLSFRDSTGRKYFHMVFME